MTGPVDLVRAVVALPIAASEALASLPRLVRALERLADPAGPLAQASSVRVPLENLAEGGGALDRLADVSATLERLATLDRSLSKLGELGPTLARIGDLSESVRQIAELEESLLKLSGLADTMTDVHESVAALATTVAPLQGTTERLGRLVDPNPQSTSEARDPASDPAPERRSPSGVKLTIRRARVSEDEATTLSALAQRSKAHWGYDDEFMARVREILVFAEAELAGAITYVLEADGEPAGVYRLVGTPPEGELADLWVEPRLIGRGLGRFMFSHALSTSAANGFRTLLIESDPNAESFYVAMGATRIGQRRSDLGRNLPLMRITVAPASEQSTTRSG